MPLLANSFFSGLLFLLGMVMVIVILIRRSRRLLRRRGNNTSPLVEVPRPQRSGRTSSTSRASDESVRQEVEQHERARDLAGMLDSKISVLQHLIAQSQRQIERLESLLETDDDATAGTSASTDSAQPTQPTATSETLRDSAEDADPRLAEIFSLADQGFSIATIAHRVGRSLPDVESILKNRANA